MNDYNGPATLLIPGKSELPVYAQFVTNHERGGLLSWSGTLTTEHADGAFFRAMTYNDRLRIRLPDGREAGLFIKHAQMTSRTAQITGTNEPPYGDWD